MTTKSQFQGALWGLLVGDALGVPYEFKVPQGLPPRAQLEMTPPPNFARTYASIPPGTWSDDGAQALALLDSLLDCEGFDAQDFAERLANWYRNGRYAVDAHVFDCGITTCRAIGEFLRGTPPEMCGSRDENSNGNGALMRVLPLVLWHKGDDEELIQLAMAQSVVTHGHLRSGLCCALYCLWAREILTGTTWPFEKATRKLREFFADSPVACKELEIQIRPHQFRAGTGSGYVVDSLISARWVMQENGFENVVKSAVALGHDTDTTACIAGGVAGLRDGFEGIPTRWLEALRGREIVEPIWEKLRLWRNFTAEKRGLFKSEVN